MNYDKDFYFSGYGEIKEAFTDDDIPKSYTSDQDFRSSNEGNDFGNNLYVFDISYQTDFTVAQPTTASFHLMV